MKKSLQIILIFTLFAFNGNLLSQFDSLSNNGFKEESSFLLLNSKSTIKKKHSTKHIGIKSKPVNFITNDSVNIRRHSIYFEPVLFGRIASFGYSYNFLYREHMLLSANVGFGAVFKFYNPQTAFLFPISLDGAIRIRNRFFLNIGVTNYTYLNYWENFSEEGKDCQGLWICPPKIDASILLPYIGTSWDFKQIVINPKIAIVATGWWIHPIPFPSIIVKLKL